MTIQPISISEENRATLEAWLTTSLNGRFWHWTRTYCIYDHKTKMVHNVALNVIERSITPVDCLRTAYISWKVSVEHSFQISSQEILGWLVEEDASPVFLAPRNPLDGDEIAVNGVPVEEAGPLVQMRPQELEEQVAVAKVLSSCGTLLWSQRHTQSSEKISYLTGLCLSLFGNRTGSLTVTFGQLSQLSKIDLSNNRLKNLPESFCDLFHLTNLNINNNELTSLPEGFGRLTNLSVLCIKNNKLTSLPDSIGLLTKLEFLILKGNQIEKLSASISNLLELTHLNLENNKLKILPDSIGNLRALQNLKLRRNQIVSCPESLIDLQKLLWLDLSNNRLETIPDLFSKNRWLFDLYLGNNRLKSLPENFWERRDLESLDLCNNNIDEISPKITSLNSLEEINLSRSEREMPNIVTFYFSQNLNPSPKQLGKI